MGRPIYEKLGFAPDYGLARFESTAPETKGGSDVVAATPEMYSDLIEFDKRMTGRERVKMLGMLFDEFPEETRIVRRADEIEGFLTMRPGANAVQIGPCTATPHVGPPLLYYALNRCAGKPVFVDVPLDNIPAVEVVKAAGLTIQREFTRMSRGPKINENVQTSWASSGAEKG